MVQCTPYELPNNSIHFLSLILIRSTDYWQLKVKPIRVLIKAKLRNHKHLRQSSHESLNWSSSVLTNTTVYCNHAKDSFLLSSNQ